MKQLKKLSLTLVALLALSTGAWAQKRGGTNADASVAKARIMAKAPRRASAIPENATILYQQNFDGTNDINELGWTFVDNDGDGVNWIMAINGKYDDYTLDPSKTSTSVPNSLYSQSFTDDGDFAINADNWAITPAIEIYESSTLSFQLAYDNISYPDKVGVYVGETANVNEMTEVLAPTGFSRTENSQFNEETVDLSAFAGKTCYIAFRHKDYDNYLVFIDDVVVYTTDPRFYSFKMPANDVTVNYELVRDMSVQMTAQVGDGTQEQPRYRVKKDGNNKFIPADMEMAAVPALFTVNDAIEQKALTQTQDYIVQIYAIDAEGQPTGDPMTFANFTFEPGIYAVKAVAADGSDYDGETALSNTFELFQGYQIVIPASEFATFYDDNNIKLADGTSADVKLYTIGGISEGRTEATVTALSGVVAASTPMLVYNGSDKVLTVTLKVTPDDANTGNTTDIAPQFMGTAVDKTFTATDMTAADYYALSGGKAFAKVMGEGTLKANQCWLQFSKNISNARAITLVFDETTKITNTNLTNLTNLTNGDWYDLNGRKLNGMPTKKGIYMNNGRKVVVR